MDTKEKRKRPRASAGSTQRRKRPVRRERKVRDTDVIYTPPKPFQRGRFLLRLATVAAVVLAVVLGMSIFFKVGTVKVSGCSKYTPWEVSEAAGIETGSNLLTISRARISGSILSKLPYVDTVRVGIILPDTVNIEITELDVVYSLEDADGNWWLMNCDGRIVEPVNNVTAKEYTKILGVRLQTPEAGQQAVALEPERTTIPVVDPTQETGEPEGEAIQATEPETTGETIAVGVTGAERLQTVLAVLKQLSNNSIVGQIDSVDVTSLYAIELWYDERFQINLGDATRLEYKIGALKATIDKMEPYESGNLDLSFTNWADKVGYMPFT